MATEKRLIDANSALAELDKFANPMPNKSGYDFLCGIATAITEIEDAPTVDAVEVVRCKDCKHYHQYHIGKTNDLCEWGKCKLISMDVDMPENGFCSYGERRNDDQATD